MKLFPDLRGDIGRASELKEISKNASDRASLFTLQSRLKIEQIIWDFVRSRGRIVYGGAALKALIGAKEPDGLFLSDDEVTDIEFYSPEPGRDVVELCEIFRFQHGMEFVQGREAVHVGTLTISVQFKRCCDVTYMPQRTAVAIPCIKAECGIWCVHPHIMAMDLLRMLTEPDTSYWRLEKAYARIQVLEMHFPLSWEYVNVQQDDAHLGTDIGQILPLFLSGTSVIVGEYAATFYEERLDDITEGVQAGPKYLQLVCVDYENDVGLARKVFTDYGLAKTETCLEAFGDLLGRSTRFLNEDGCVVVEIIDAHPRCVPCSPVSPEVGRVGSSLFCLVTAMACHLRAFVTGDRVTLSQQSLICRRLLASRSCACERNSPARAAFEDFGLDHIIGKTTSDMVLHTHLKQCSPTKSKSWLRYNPEGHSSAHAQDNGSRKRMVQSTFASRTGHIKSVTLLN